MKYIVWLVAAAISLFMVPSAEAATVNDVTLTVTNVYKTDTGVQVILHYVDSGPSSDIEAVSCTVGANRYGCTAVLDYYTNAYSEGDFTVDLTSQDSSSKGGTVTLLVDGSLVTLAFGRATTH